MGRSFKKTASKQPVFDELRLTKNRQQLLRHHSVSRSQNSGDSDQPEARRRHDSLRKASCDEGGAYVLAGLSDGVSVPLGRGRARAVDPIGGAEVCQFIAQASSRLLGAEPTTTLNQHPTRIRLYIPITSLADPAHLGLSQPYQRRAQLGMLLPGTDVTPGLTREPTSISVLSRCAGSTLASWANVRTFLHRVVFAAASRRHLHLAHRCVLNKLTTPVHLTDTCNPTTCTASHRLRKLSNKNLCGLGISLVHLACPASTSQDRTLPVARVLTYVPQDTALAPTRTPSSSTHPRHLPRQEHISTQQGCRNTQYVATVPRQTALHHQWPHDPIEPTSSEAHPSPSCLHPAPVGTPNLEIAIAMYTDWAPCIFSHRQWHTDPRRWHCQPHMHTGQAPHCRHWPNHHGIRQLSLLLLSGDVELNPGPLMWHPIIGSILACILSCTWNLHPCHIADTATALAGLLVMVCSLMLMAPATCHRGSRPQRAKFRLRLRSTTASCVRYVARPTWWRHCRHNHTMWSTNPFCCTDGTLASRYRMGTLSHAVTSQQRHASVPGATLTQARWLPLVPVHVRTVPKRIHATRPLQPASNLDRTSPTGTTTNSLAGQPTITATDCSNHVVRTGGGPKYDTKQKGRVKSAVSRRSHPHNDRAAQRIASGMSLTQLDMYCEPQRDMQCGVHALNAMAGRKVADGATVTRMLYEYWPEGRSDNRPSYAPGGNYSVTAINVWLWAHARTPITLINFYNNQAQVTGPLTMERLLAQAPPGCDKIFMWFQKDGYINHYKCIRRHAATGMWFELDSMDAGITREATPMLEEDWANLIGDFYFAGAINGNTYAGSGDLGWCPPSEKVTIEDVSTVPLVDWDDVIFASTPLKPFRRAPAHAGDLRRAARVPGANYEWPAAPYLPSDSDDESPATQCGVVHTTNSSATRTPHAHAPALHNERDAAKKRGHATPTTTFDKPSKLQRTYGAHQPLPAEGLSGCTSPPLTMPVPPPTDNTRHHTTMQNNTKRQKVATPNPTYAQQSKVTKVACHKHVRSTNPAGTHAPPARTPPLHHAAKPPEIGMLRPLPHRQHYLRH
jgi:hypothetical protein